MMLRSFRFLSPVLVMLAGCAAPEGTSTAPDLASDDDLGTLQAVTYTGITMTSATPSATLTSNWVLDGTVKATISFTGSGTRAMGACLLNRVQVDTYDDTNRVWSTAPVACTSASQCAAYNTYTGGSAYCTAPNNGATKYCYVRPGTQANFCVGTPVTAVPVTSPATLTSPTKGAWSYYRGLTTEWVARGFEQDLWEVQTHEAHWIMYGCMSGCSGSTPTPSVSSERVFWGDEGGSESSSIVN